MILLLAVIYVVFISLGLPDSIFGVAWPVLHIELGVAESFASVYAIIVGACTSAVSLVAGKLIRKFGTGKITLFSILLTVIGLVGMSYEPNIAVMIFFAVILGYGAGAIDTGLNNFVSLHYKASHMNWLHCFWGIGVTASPLIMSFFLKEGSSWRNGYRAVAAVQIAIFLFVLFTMPLWKKAESSPVSQASEEKGDKSFFEIFKIKGVITGILSLAFYFAGENIIGTWGASYLVHIYSMPADKAAKWVSLYYGGIMLGRLLAGFAAIKLNDNKLIRLGSATSAAGIVLLLLPFKTVSLAGLLLIGVGFGPIFPSVIHSVPERFGKTYSADITGYHMFGAYAIGFAIQLAFGFTATNTSFTIFAPVLLVLAALFAAANELTTKKVRNNINGK